jgi:hypothetical protein
MTSIPFDSPFEEESGLDFVLRNLTGSYPLTDRGRMVGISGGGVPPRFIFARSKEGCLWRFRGDLATDLVEGISKLAGRERGWTPLDSGEGFDSTVDPASPDRLVMFARLLGGGTRDPAPFRRVPYFRDDVLLAEIWNFD